VAYLGDLDEPQRRGIAETARGETGDRQADLVSPEVAPAWVEVDPSHLRVERVRDFGAYWLGLQILEKLGLLAFLDTVVAQGREEIPWPMMALVLVLMRLVDPSSDLRIAEHLFERSALSDLLGIPPAKVNDDRLYRALDQIRPHKEALAKHLKERLGQLRQFQEELAQDEGWETIMDGLSAKLISSAESTESFILCRSVARGAKEKAMHERFAARIEDGLTKLAEACGGEKKLRPSTAERRIGALLTQNSRAKSLFQVTVGTRADGGATVTWEKRAKPTRWADVTEGCYLLRTNVTGRVADLWRSYIQLTEAEAAFRIQKDDLRIRPIWHQKEDRVAAHILICFLAYVLWKTLAQMCRAAGLGGEPRKVLDELGAIKLVDVVLPTKDGVELRRRCIAQPTKGQAILLDRLKLRLPPVLAMPHV
jgi:hypothetical protein